MKQFTTFRAVRDDGIDNSTTIKISAECPRCGNINQQDALFQEQADAICALLYHSLPGGVFDRLLGEMLKIKSSHFIVSHDGK